MKKVFLVCALIVGCVPKGYVKDPSQQPVTRADFMQMKAYIDQNIQALYQKLHGEIKPAPAPEKPKSKKHGK